jgi:DNA invertase Pin-like site-specific DNA recombinase
MALIGYARVSTSEQHLDLQIEALTAAGAAKIFADQGVSGTLASRPQLDAALTYLREGDVFLVWKLDRLGRNVRQVLDLLEGMRTRGVEFRSLTEGLQTTGPMGQAMVTIMAAFAELERNMLVERTKAGLEAARKKGRLGGRPRKLTEQKLAIARTLYGAGKHTVGEIAATLGVSEATVYRYLAASRPARAAMDQGKPTAGGPLEVDAPR